MKPIHLTHLGMKIIAWLLLASLALVSIDTQAQTPQAVKQIDDLTTANYPQWDALYKHLHQNPELSLQEEKSAARMALELKKLGFEVKEKIGGHGVAGIYKNGHGPTVLIRSDMDACLLYTSRCV